MTPAGPQGLTMDIEQVARGGFEDSDSKKTHVGPTFRGTESP